MLIIQTKEEWYYNATTNYICRDIYTINFHTIVSNKIYNKKQTSTF